MRELFLNILTASILGSIIIMVILLLRPILKKAPKNTLCLLWLLAALRLLLPFEIQSSFSLQPELDAVAIPGAEYAEQMTSGFQSSTQDVLLPPVEWEDVPVLPSDIENTQQPVDDAVIYEIDVPLKVKILENYEQILVWLWAAGAAMLLTYSAVAYGLLKLRIRGSVVLSEGVWACGRVESAFVLGFFRPQIYLSANLPENARDYVLAHEKCHIRRGDHWWKLLGYLTLAIHWFNPLVWLAYSLLCRDLEMACDEAVVKTMSVAERKTYSAALLACSVRGARIAACPVAFGEVSVKQRIKNVLHYRKPAFWITIVALVLVAVVAVCFLTSPEEQQDIPTDPTEGLTEATEPTEATQSEAEFQAELIQLCRNAMLSLQNAETGYQYIVNMADPNEVINTYLFDGQNWCFKYRRPGWDYQDVVMLAYDGKIYTFEGDSDENGVMSAIHYWKKDDEGVNEEFLLYPFDLDWKTIQLKYLSSGTNEDGQTVTFEFPEYMDVFTFCFDSEGALLWFETGDSSGEPEATTTRTYVQYPGDSISNHLRGLYSEALNTVNENELVYTDGFYQSIFTPESSPLNAAELFYGFYQNPQRFIDRLAAAEKVNPSVSAQVIECMGKAVNNYAPYLFQYTLNQFPDTFYPEILGGLKAIFEEPEQENPDTDNQKKLTREEIWNLCVNAYEELRRWPTYRVCLSTAGDPNYSFHHIYGENYYIDSAVELGYDKLMYQGKLYFRVAPSYMDNKEIPSGWMSENWAKSHYPGVFDGTREQFFWGSRDWDSLGLVLRTWKQEDNGLTVKFTEKADEHHEWTFTLNPFGTLTCIRASRDERMEKQWDIQLYERMAIDKPRIMYASAYRESPDAVIVRDQAFYEELFTRVTDGAYTTMWISHLFEALYAQPEEFVRQLSRKYYEDSELVKDVLKSMSYETQWYEPERFNQVVEDLRKVQNLDQSVLNLMVEYLQVK